MSYKFQREKNKLKSILGEGIYKSLKKYKMIVAGGFITSLFSNSEFNDVDIYGTDPNLTLEFAEDNLQNSNILYHTKKATMFIKDELTLQLIHYKSYKDVADIFDSFDFTVCMGAYDFEKEEFILHETFLKDMASRSLFFNAHTDYPIISMLRTSKYKEKGYDILKSEFTRIIMACMELKIESYEELKIHLGGLYGHNLDALFEDVEDDEFDMSVAIDKLEGIYFEEKDFEDMVKENFFTYEVEEVLGDIDKTERKYIKINDDVYRVYNKDKIVRIYSNDKIDNISEHEFISVEEVFEDFKLYKFVEEVADGDYRSFFDGEFKYELNKLVVPRDTSNHSVLYFNDKKSIKNSSYYGYSNKVLVEALFNPDNISAIRYGVFTVKEAYITRVVPEEEWNSWI